MEGYGLESGTLVPLVLGEGCLSSIGLFVRINSIGKYNQ